MFYLRFFRYAQRVAAWAGVLALASEAWRAVEEWVTSNLTSNEGQVQRMQTAGEQTMVARNILATGGFELAKALRQFDAISIDIFVRCAFIHAITRNSILPPAASQLSRFLDVFGTDIPEAWNDEDLARPVALGLLMRELEASDLVDFYSLNNKQ